MGVYCSWLPCIEDNILEDPGSRSYYGHFFEHSLVNGMQLVSLTRLLRHIYPSGFVVSHRNYIRSK